MRAVEQRRAGVVTRMLADPRTRIDARNDSGASALFRAVATAQPDMIRQLLAHGADPGLADEQGRSPRSVAQTLGRADLQSLLGNN